MRKLFTFLIVASLVFVFSAPTPAADKTIEDRLTALEQTIGSMTIYGSARFHTWYNDGRGAPYAGLNPSADDKSLTWDSSAIARLGGRVTKGKITGVYELGVDDDYGVLTRIIRGDYNFGPGTLVIGQDYTPLGTPSYSTQAYADDLALLGLGGIYGGRVPQIKVKMNNGLQIALVEHQKASKLNAHSGDADVLMPKIEVLYNLKRDMFFADVFGGFSTFKVEDIVMTDGGANFGDETVNAWAAGIGGGLNLDPAYIKAQVYMAQNAATFGLLHYDSAGAYFDTAGKVVDEDNLGFEVVVGTRIDKYNVEAGYGYVSSEPDVSGSKKNTAWSYYLNCMVPIYGSFFIVPEIGVIDYGDGFDGKDEKKDVKYAGLKWQVNF
jgi:hypothetical protein